MIESLQLHALHGAVSSSHDARQRGAPQTDRRPTEEHSDVPGTWRQKNQPKSPGGPKGPRILLYSGISWGHTRRLAWPAFPQVIRTA